MLFGPLRPSPLRLGPLLLAFILLGATLAGTGCGAVPCPAVGGPVTASYPHGLTLNVRAVKAGDKPEHLNLWGTLDNASPATWGRLKLRYSMKLATTDEPSTEFEVDGELESPFLMPGKWQVSTNHWFHDEPRPPGEPPGAPLVFGRSLTMRGQANLPAAAHGRCLALRSITANGAPGGVQFVHYHLRTVAPVVRADAGFEDEEIQVGVAPFPHQLALTVRNKSARPLRLRWEDLVYVAPDGQAERLVAWPARKAPPDTAALVPPEVPALVPPGAELRIKVAPDRPKALGHGGTLGDGPTVLPQGPGVEHLVGKEIGLYLPIELGDTPRPLHLRLRIERISWDDAKIYWLP